jgi:hypothetical protein
VSTTGRWEELFSGRRWRLAEEISGTARLDGAEVEFTRGRFEVKTPGCAFTSPLSTNLGVRGEVFQETDETGSADIPGSRVAIGVHAVRKVRERFGTIW